MLLADITGCPAVAQMKCMAAEQHMWPWDKASDVVKLGFYIWNLQGNISGFRSRGLAHAVIDNRFIRQCMPANMNGPYG